MRRLGHRQRPNDALCRSRASVAAEAGCCRVCGRDKGRERERRRRRRRLRSRTSGGGSPSPLRVGTMRERDERKKGVRKIIGEEKLKLMYTFDYLDSDEKQEKPTRSERI